MGRFVSSEAIPIHTEDDPENVIYIKPRMDVGTQALVYNEMATISAQASLAGGKVPSAAEIRMNLGAYNLALLIHNVVRWSGPDFDSVPCNPDNLKRLDPDDALYALVLLEINERNRSRVASPNLSSEPGKNGSTQNGANKKRDANLSIVPA